jgi:hypothetical protein
MRAPTFFLCVLVFVVGSASATPEDLSNGVFIAHYSPSMWYTVPGPCELIDTFDPIETCVDQNNRIDGWADHQFWFIICAWDEEKEWCTTQIGIEGYDPGVWLFQMNEPCYPGGGTGVETFSNNFPHGDPWGGPSGVILTPSDGYWGPANFEPVWWFEGYAYGEAYGTTVIPLGVDPSTGFAGWVNCEEPPAEFPAESFGAMGVNTDGVYCCPMGMEYFACCFEDGTCELMTQDLCDAAGGEFHPEWDYCEPNECPQPAEGACCFAGGECVESTEEWCESVGAYWLPDFPCDPNPCPTSLVVCCFDDGSCEVIGSHTCEEAGGVVFWDYDRCIPNPCPPSGTDDASWGSIKAMYR